MREIKFRIWDKNTNKFLIDDKEYEYLVSAKSFQCLQVNQRFIGEHDGYMPKAIIQQFTGLKDSQKKEIYEGDILRFHTGKPYQAEYEVIWQGGGFSLISAKRDGDDFGVFTKNIEFVPSDNPVIIGNVFENPELTK